MSEYLEERIWVMWGNGLAPAAIAARLNADLVYDDGKPHWDAAAVEKTLIWRMWHVGKLDTIDIRNKLGRLAWPESEIERQVHQPDVHKERLALALTALRRAELRLGVRRRDAAGAGRNRPDDHVGV